MKKLIKHLNETITKEKALIRFIFIMIIIGVIAGSLFINLITEVDKKLMIEQVETFFSSIKKLSSDVFGINVVISSLLNNILQLIIIFVLGISMIGIPAVIFILFFKGFTLGTTIGTFILKYQLKGVIASILYVVPVMIINLLIYVFLSFFAVYVSSKFLKALIKKDSLNFKKFLGKYLLSLIISIILMSICCLLDGFLAPLLLKLFTFLI